MMLQLKQKSSIYQPVNMRQEWEQYRVLSYDYNVEWTGSFLPCRCTDMFASIHAAIVNTSCETHQETLNKLITDYKTIIPVGFFL